MVGLFGSKTTLPGAGEALPGRDEPMPVPERHAVLGTPIAPPYPEGSAAAEFALGCFWGEERLFWQLDGVLSTAVGYAGGLTPNPTYEEVCSGRTGHAETVRVVYDPARTGYEDLLKVFWEAHDPTQGMRQGNDVGSQYRSIVFYGDDAERAVAERTRDGFQRALATRGYGEITTELAPRGSFYFAEAYHQQYLHKNPAGYCPVHATGVTR